MQDINKNGIQTASSDSDLPVFSFQPHESVQSNVLPLIPNMVSTFSRVFALLYRLSGGKPAYMCKF